MALAFYQGAAMSNKSPIVVCGESLLDVFQNGETPTGLTLDAVVGGSPLNVAMGVARLGHPALFFGGLSRDFLGERIELFHLVGIALILAGIWLTARGQRSPPLPAAE